MSTSILIRYKGNSLDSNKENYSLYLKSSLGDGSIGHMKNEDLRRNLVGQPDISGCVSFSGLNDLILETITIKSQMCIKSERYIF